MKILRVIASMNPEGGGPSEGVRRIDTVLSKLGHVTDVVTLDSPTHQFSDGYPGVITGVGPGTGRYCYTPALIPWLKNNAKKYDFVIVNGLWQYHGYAVWRVLAKSNIPYFVFTHGMLDPWFKYTYPFKHLKKWLYWPWAEYRVLRDARAVIFTCEDEKLLARESFWLYKVNEAVTAYGTSSPPSNGAELAEKFLLANPELRGKRIALFLSRIQEKKGCDLLIKAFAQVALKEPLLQLVVAGPDQTGWMGELKSLASQLGIADRICWTGMLQGDAKWGAFYSSEVFCLPSHQENFGIVVAESLACGKPVLISNKVNIWREIEGDLAGFVGDDTVEATVTNFENWLALSPADYLAMSQRASRCFSQRFHIQRAAERLLEIIQEHKQ